jgi:phosphatidate phosphatase APP1
MINWRHALLAIATNVEDHFDDLKVRLERRLSSNPIIITPYLSHGSREKFHLCGRVLADKGIVSAKDNDTIWDNLVNMYRRMSSDEVPYARVRIRFGEQETEVTADEEGFFEVFLNPGPLYRADQITYDIQCELVDYPHRIEDLPAVSAVGQVIVPPPDAQFGVISDLDDTVIKTDVLDILKMARNTFLRNSRTRLPFEGVAAFYRALQSGINNTYNPIFYVSSSPWNLYDLLLDFFDVRDIPIGPFFLKDLGLTREHFFSGDHMHHKFAAIRSIMETHPNLSFILIGDSGQEDTAIYRYVTEQYPGRVLAIYIRDVSEDEARERKILNVADFLKSKGIDLLLVPDTVAAAEHAILKGFILESSMMDIRIERTEDKKPPEPLEKLLDPNATAEDLQPKEVPEPKSDPDDPPESSS